MALELCSNCGRRFLTESAPYLVFPHSSGYHLFCLDCVTGDSNHKYRELLDIIRTKTKGEIKNG